MFDIRPYADVDGKVWNAFVSHSRQGTFLFDRRYMDYHRDRFRDFSLMFYKKGQLFALLPANIDGDTLWSHQGLTYGGLLTDDHATAADVADLFADLNAFLRGKGIRKVVYKPMPWIYQRQPSEEDLYALTNVCHANVTARYISSSIILRDPVRWRYGRKYDANKAAACGVTVGRDDEALPQFWQILDDNLMENHHAKPVHTLAEMRLLQSRFPDSIRLYVSRFENRVVAGTLLFVTPQVVHTQYISASGEGKRLHAIDLMFRKVFSDFGGYLYFDFGNSNEDHGKTLNRGLIFQKEGFGGRGVCYDWYKYEL